MRRYLFKTSMVSIATALVLGLAGCGSSDDGGSTATATTSSSGSATKGPFKEGSLVVAYKLNADGTRDVNQTTLTTDGRGKFSFTSLPWSGATEFVISGEYLNEATGNYMVLPISRGLSAVANITAGQAASININLLTDLAAKNTIAAMAGGTDITTAKENAQKSVSELFNIDLTEGTSLEDLDPLDAAENTAANTQLLLLSTAVLNTTNPESVMQNLADDLADDGKVNDEALAALNEVSNAVQNVDLGTVVATLKNADIGDVIVEDNVDSALNGRLAIDSNISFSPKYDASLDVDYISNEVIVDKIYGGSGAISIEGGEYSIDGAAFTSAATTVSNGQTVRIKLHSSNDFSTQTTATVTIGGKAIVYNVTTKDNPVLPDTTPAPLTFTPVFDAVKSTVVTSNAVVVEGINQAVDVTVDNGEYEVNSNGTWIAAGTDTTVNQGDTIKVRHTAANTGATQIKTIVSVGDINATFSSYTIADDTIPNPFTFTAIHDADLNTNVEANTTISGINVPTPISIENGEYSFDGSSWTSTDGTVSNGDALYVRTRSADTYETSTEAKVTIGNVVETLTVTTMSNPTVPDAVPNTFTFNYLTDQNRATDVVSNVITVSGINEVVEATVIDGYMDINGSGTWVTDANVSAGTTIQLKHTTAATFETEVTSTLTIGGVSADFTSKTLVEDAIPDPISFDRNESVPVGATNILSNSVTITGINTDINISIENGEYSLDGGSTWSTDTGVVSNNTSVIVKQLAAATTPETPTVTTLHVGPVQASFTTVTLPVAPDIIGTPVITAQEDAYYRYRPDLNTSAGSVDVWSIANKPTWAEFDSETGELSGVPRNENVGIDANVTITVSNVIGSDSITFDINVVNTNDAPAAQDINATTNEDTVVTVDTSSYVTDVDVNDSYSVSVSNPMYGVASVSGTSIIYTPAANFFGEDTFTYTVTDEANATASATVHVSVIGVPDVAVISGDLNVSVSEDAGVYNGVITVTDGDVNESALVATNISGTYGTFQIASDGAWSYTITDETTVQALAQGETLTDSVQVTSLDGGTVANIIVTILGVNDAPVVVAHAPVSTKKQVDFNITVAAQDVDHNATLQLVEATSSPSATVSFDANGTITFNAPTSGAYTLTYTFSDEYNATAEGTVEITVTNSDAPIALADTITLDEDTNATINVLANDSDDQTAIADLNLSIVTPPSNGQAVVEADNTILYTPNENFYGSDVFIYKVIDEDGGFAEANVTITVNSVNDLPQIVNDTYSVLSGSVLTLDILANDTDVDGDTLTISDCNTTDINGTVTVNSSSIDYTSDANFEGTESFVCQVTDGVVTVDESVTVVVSTNHPPVFSDIELTLTEGETVTGQLQVSDPDDDNVTFTAISSATQDANITINEDGTYVVTALQAGTSSVNVEVTDGITAPVSANFTVKIIITNDSSTNYNLSEGQQLTSTEFDALSAGAAIPADTKLYDMWGADFNGTAFERTDAVYLEFLSDGTFIISEDNGTAYAHSGNLDSGKTSVSLGTAYDAAANVADFVMLDANMSATDIANEIPFLATLNLPQDAVVYKTAVKMTQDQYDIWGPAQDCSVYPCGVYDTLADMVENNAHGVVSYNRENYKRLLVFGNDQNLSAGSGTVVEVDMTGVYDGLTTEPVVINANAGTWTLVTGGYTDDADNAIDMIIVDVAEGLTNYDNNTLFVEQGAVIDGNTTNSVYRGDYMPAGSAGIEYRFNEAANAAIQNYFHPVTIDEWTTNVQDANNTEVNASVFESIVGLPVDSASLVALSPLYELSIDTQFAQPAHFNLMQMIFNSDSTVNLFVTTDGVVNLFDSETLGYVVDTTENNITLSRTMDDGSSLEVFALKVVSEDDASMIGLTMPSGAKVYTLAGLQLVDEAYYELDSNATVWDANGTAYSGFDANVTNFVTTVADNNYAIDVRYDSNGTMYALLLNNNGGNTVGDVEEINLDTNETFVVGSWEIRPMVAKNVIEDTLLVTLTTNNGYHWTEITYGSVGGPTLLRGDAGFAGEGGYMFLADSIAAEIIQLNFANQFLLPFTYEELANKTLYGVFDDGSNYFTMYYHPYRDNRRDFELGTLGFTSAYVTLSPQEYIIQNGNLLILDDTGAVSYEIQRTSRNNLFYQTTNVITGNNSTIFYDIDAANYYYNSLQ